MIKEASVGSILSMNDDEIEMVDGAGFVGVVLAGIAIAVAADAVLNMIDGASDSLAGKPNPGEE